MQTPEKRLLSNAVFLYIMQISVYVFPLLMFPYLTRILGPDRYGVVVFANAIIVYFQTLIDFGFVLSATSICATNRDNKEKLSHITFGVIQSKILLALLGAFILFVCCLAIQEFKNKRTFLWLSYIGITLSVFLPDYLFRGIEQMSIITYRVLVSKIVYTGLVFLLVRNSADYLNVPIAIIGSNVIAVLLTWYEIIHKLKLQFIRVTFKETLAYLYDSSIFFVSRIAVSMYQTLNTVVLGGYFSSVKLAQYGAANTLISSGRALLSPVSESIYPYMIIQKKYKIVKKIILILEPFICLVCTGLFIFAEAFITFMCGDQYAGSVPAFRAMLPLIVISLPTYLLGYPVMGALGIINVANTSVIIASIFHISGLFILFIIKHLDFISVALLTFLTEFLVLTIRLCYIMLKLKERRSERVIKGTRN